MMWRPTWAEIDLDAIRHNVRALRALVSPPARQLCVVKANAYGHGDVAVARACLEAGAEWLAVALVEEGARLRAAGIEAPILVLVEPPPQAAKDLVELGIVPSVWSPAGAEVVSDAAMAAGVRHPVHVCVDTGLHREGVLFADALDFVRHVSKLPGVEIQGLWSHFANADLKDAEMNELQMARFAEMVGEVSAMGLEPIRHLANSAATISLPGAHWDLVRCGIAIYGLYPDDWLRPMVDLRPAMRVVTHVGTVKRVRAGEGVSYGLTYRPRHDTTVAALPIGYADGFSRLLSNRAEVLLHGHRRPVAGRVTMDQIMVDCGDDPVHPGDEVVVLGPQHVPGGASEEITADEIAAKLDTINYEVVCAIGHRVPRVYRG